MQLTVIFVIVIFLILCFGMVINQSIFLNSFNYNEGMELKDTAERRRKPDYYDANNKPVNYYFEPHVPNLK
jgi:hypothetical protein